MSHSRKFFDAYLKGDQEAAQFLRRSLHDKATLAAGFELAIREPSPLPQQAQIAESVKKNGIDAAMRFVKEFGLDLTEEMSGDAAALGLYSEGKLLEGLALMRYRCELYPASWGAEASSRSTARRWRSPRSTRRISKSVIAGGANPRPSERSLKMLSNGIKKAEGR